MSDVRGIDGPAVTAWLHAHVPALRGALRFEPITGGLSNLTYIVSDEADRRVVLRRPPVGEVLASAHDMLREHRVIAALAATAVPTPRALAVCSDAAVTDAPFFVMDFVDGHVIRDPDVAAALLDIDARRRVSEALVDTLAAIHAVDLDAAGLSDLGRHEGYVARQLRRWHGQWQAQRTHDGDDIDRIHDALVERIPEQSEATLVHGDFRLDNCMVDAHGEVLAVLDWEICTIGDPLADLGMLMVYWTGPGDERSPWPSATTAAGFLDRDGLAKRYADVSGRSLANITFALAFASWKLACIIEGVYARSMSAPAGHIPVNLAQLRIQADIATRRAATMVECIR